MDIADAYLNASTTSVVLYMYFEPAHAAIHCELGPEYKKCIMKNGRIKALKASITMSGNIRE